jgi:hypothetical protein
MASFHPAEVLASPCGCRSLTLRRDLTPRQASKTWRSCAPSRFGPRPVAATGGPGWQSAAQYPQLTGISDESSRSAERVEPEDREPLGEPLHLGRGYR